MAEERLPSVIHETCFTWDHDTGQIFIDTTQRTMKTKLKRLGLEPYNVFDELSSYSAYEDDVTITVRKRKARKISKEHKEKLVGAMRKARAAKKAAKKGRNA